MNIWEMRKKYFGRPDDQDKIAALEQQGYRVEIRDVAAATFNARYAVYQGSGDKVVIVDENGLPVAVQG